MKHYVVDADRDSGIIHDPKYLKSVALIEQLPPLDIDETSPYYGGGDKCLPPIKKEPEGGLV